jgi:hypothetical protein
MIPTDEDLRRLLCDAITVAAGKPPLNVTGQCKISVQGNTLVVRPANAPKIALIEMRYLYGSAISFTVTRSRYDGSLVTISPGVDMTVESLGAHLFETFVSALRVM